MKVPLVQEAVEPNPTDRKKGCKWHLLVDARGVSFSIIIAASRHDVTQLEEVLDRERMTHHRQPFGAISIPVPMAVAEMSQRCL